MSRVSKGPYYNKLIGWVLALGILGVTRYGAFRGEAIPGGKTLIEDMPLSLQQDVTYEETQEYIEKVIMM